MLVQLEAFANPNGWPISWAILPRISASLKFSMLEGNVTM